MDYFDRKSFSQIKVWFFGLGGVNVGNGSLAFLYIVRDMIQGGRWMQWVEKEKRVAFVHWNVECILL